jgi:hypothetical protein
MGEGFLPRYQHLRERLPDPELEVCLSHALLGMPLRKATESSLTVKSAESFVPRLDGVCKLW